MHGYKVNENSFSTIWPADELEEIPKGYVFIHDSDDGQLYLITFEKNHEHYYMKGPYFLTL